MCDGANGQGYKIYCLHLIRKNISKLTCYLFMITLFFLFFKVYMIHLDDTFPKNECVFDV